MGGGLKLQAVPPGACDSSLSRSAGIPSWTWVAQGGQLEGLPPLASLFPGSLLCSA